MSKIISITNQKGGVGKTTTVINLSACLAEKGKKVLAVDMDPQGNMTSGFGIEKISLENTVYQLIIDDCTLSECIIKDKFENLSIIPSNINLSGAEVELIDLDQKEFLLKEKLDSIKNNYDYIIIDCPPSLNLLTVNALATSDTVLIPIQCEYYALEGLSQLMQTITLIQERLNENLMIDGIVFTMYDSRTNLSTQVVENVKENLSVHIYNTLIPRNVRLAESPSYGLPITIYDGKSSGAQAYRSLTEEMLQNMEGGENLE